MLDVSQNLLCHISAPLPVSKSHLFSCLQIHLTDGRRILTFSVADFVLAH